VAGDEIVVGSRRLLESSGVALDLEIEGVLAALRDRGRTAVLVAVNGEVAGLIGLADSIRDSAATAIARLRELGVRRVLMLTGDERQAALAVAREAGIMEVHAGLLPEEKLALVRRLQADGYRVAMVGDGINDAPALAAADTSIAMGRGGSDVAVETADIALLSDDLTAVPRAIAISRATLRVMRQNLAIAVLTVAALLAGVLAGQVHMAGGMLVHQLSVLLVIVNAARLLRTPDTGGIFAPSPLPRS
jgi:Cd2+/Zn2+-exporting ATPase